MRRHSHLVSMEEGFRGRGGMDSMLFEIISRHHVPAPLLNLGVEPAYSFEQGTRQQLHERVGIGEQGALADILGFYKGQTAVSGGV